MSTAIDSITGNDCDENALVSQVLAGDRQAFERLYHKHYDQIYGIVCRFRLSGDDTDDLVQMTFVKAFEALDRFRGDAAFSTWLTQIALNFCRSHCRVQTRRGKWVVEAEDLDEPFHHGINSVAYEDPQKNMQIQARQDVVRRCIKRLPRLYQKAMWLKYVQDQSYEAIIKELQVSEGTAKTWLFRGRNQVAQELKKRRYQSVLKGQDDLLAPFFGY